MESGEFIFVQSDDNRVDDYRSLRNRAEGMLKKIDTKDDKKYREAAGQQSMTFIHLVKFLHSKVVEESGVSIGVFAGPFLFTPRFP